MTSFGISFGNFLIKQVAHKLKQEVDSIEKFVTLSQTERENNEKLEQLRALDNNIKINVALAESSPIGVDTKEDYLALKKIMEYKT